MKSVDVTRVIPSRWAASVAIVDFPVPGRAADEQEDRHVEPLQCVAAGAGGASSSLPRPRRAPPRRARRGGRDRARARRARRGRDPRGGRSGRRARGRGRWRRARGPSALSRRRTSSPSGSGTVCRRSLIRANLATSRSVSSRSGFARERNDVVRREHDLGALRERRLRDDVDRGGLQLDQEDVGVDVRRARDEAARGRRGCPRRGRRGRRERPSRCAASGGVRARPAPCRRTRPPSR